MVCTIHIRIPVAERAGRQVQMVIINTPSPIAPLSALPEDVGESVTCHISNFDELPFFLERTVKHCMEYWASFKPSAICKVGTTMRHTSWSTLERSEESLTDAS